jgi:hypothetical protein
VRQVVKVVAGVIGFTLLAVLLALRIAIAAVLAVVTPIVMPILALLSGGGLLVAIGFACVGHWHDAVKGIVACCLSGLLLSIFSAFVQLINPWTFIAPIRVARGLEINR